MISKRELNELFLQDDQFREEMREWEERRAALARPLVKREGATPGLIYKQRADASQISSLHDEFPTMISAPL